MKNGHIVRVVSAFLLLVRSTVVQLYMYKLRAAEARPNGERREESEKKEEEEEKKKKLTGEESDKK